MTRRILILGGLLPGAAAGCTSLLLGATAGCGTDDTVGTIDFQVTGGFTGHGDGTPSLRIEPEGMVTRTSAGGTTETATLDLDTTLDLDHKLRTAKFASLSPTYIGCADCYVYVVSVELGGTTYTVQADTMAEVPMPLGAVIATLKDISLRPLDHP